MNEPKISLCLAYPNYNNPDFHILFRVADYDPDSDILYSVPFYDEDYAETPKRIGAHPKDIYPGMTVLREWEYDTEEPSRTRSYSYDGSIFEIVFPEELSEIAYSDTDEIRKVLCEGFSIDENVSENILISIGKSGSHNAFLLCRKRDLKKMGNGLYVVPSDTRDMLHSVHWLEEYDIVDSNIIDTSNGRISLSNGQKAPTRYFYNSTSLPERVGIFHPIAFSNYVPTFVSNYIKKNKGVLQFSLNDIRRITDVLDAILRDNEYIGEFFRITGYTNEQLQELLPKYKQIIVESLFGDSIVDAIMQRCLIKDPSMHERFIELVKESWVAEKTEEKQKILDEIENLKKTCVQYEADLCVKTELRNTLNSEISNLEKSIVSKNDELIKIQADIENELKEFANNVVHNTALYAVAQSAISNGKVVDIDIVTLEPNVTGESETLDNYDDFQEALADNLIIIGYEDIVADEMAQLISYSISEHLPILLSSNEDEIAKCIAAMFDSAVTVINIGSGMNAVEYIPVIEKRTDNKVVLINGAFSGLSTEHFNAIRYHFSNKGFVTLFSLDSDDAGLISKNVYEKSMYLECGCGFSYPALKELNRYITNTSVFIKYYSDEDFSKQRKKLKPFVEAGIINAISATQYAKFMIDIECDINRDWLLLLQLCINSKAKHKADIMRDWLDKNGIDIDTLNNYL